MKEHFLNRDYKHLLIFKQKSLISTMVFLYFLHIFINDLYIKYKRSTIIIPFRIKILFAIIAIMYACKVEDKPVLQKSYLLTKKNFDIDNINNYQILNSINNENVQIIDISDLKAFSQFEKASISIDEKIRVARKRGLEPMMKFSDSASANAAAMLVRKLKQQCQPSIKYWLLKTNSGISDPAQKDKIIEKIKSVSSSIKQIDPEIKFFISIDIPFDSHLYRQILYNENKGLSNNDEYGNWYIDGIIINYSAKQFYNQQDNFVSNYISEFKGMLIEMNKLMLEVNIKFNRGLNSISLGISDINLPISDYCNYKEINQNKNFYLGQIWAELYALSEQYGIFLYEPSETLKENINTVSVNNNAISDGFISIYNHISLMKQFLIGEYIFLESSNAKVKAFATASNRQRSIFLMNLCSNDTLLAQINNGGDDYTMSKSTAKITNNDFKIDQTIELMPATSILILINGEGTITKKICLKSN
jgi:hypothetical protein